MKDGDVDSMPQCSKELISSKHRSFDTKSGINLILDYEAWDETPRPFNVELLARDLFSNSWVLSFINLINMMRYQVC